MSFEALRLTSTLPLSQRSALEALLFFNVRQHALRGQIEATIARFGMPEIVEERGLLRVAVAALPDVQCLYALRGDREEPIGVVVYVRDSIDRITVVHLSVAPDEMLRQPGAGRFVLHRLLHQIRRVARLTTGIRHVELAYRAVRVARGTPPLAAAAIA